MQTNQDTNREQTFRFIQFGDGPALRPLVNAWIDAYNQGNEPVFGICAIGKVGNEQKTLISNEGRYGLHTLGIGEKAFGSERRAIGCIKKVVSFQDWERVLSYAGEEELSTLLTDASNEALHPSAGDSADAPLSLAGQVTGFLCERFRLGLPPLQVVCLEPVRDNGSLLRSACLALAHAWRVEEALLHWLMNEVRFFSSRCLREATMVVMNAAEEGEEPQEVLLAEGFGQWWIEGTELPTIAKPLSRLFAGIRLTDKLAEETALFLKIWNSLKLFSSVLRDAMGYLGLTEVVLDPKLRRSLAQSLAIEIPLLPGETREKRLQTTADCFARLENPFFAADEGFLLEEWMTVWKKDALQLVRLSADGEQGFGAIAVFFGVLLMQLIAKNESGPGFMGLSCDMDAETLAYAVLADDEVWGEDLRKMPGLLRAMVVALRDLQLTGVYGSLERSAAGV